MKYTLKEKKEYKTEIYNKYFADILKALDDVFHMKLKTIGKLYFIILRPKHR